MSDASSRWWEFYLPRYFMPCIAGVAIFSWLITLDGVEIRPILFFIEDNKNLKLNTASLILLFLYGSLFCYIASLPALVWHVTRFLEFKYKKFNIIWNVFWMSIISIIVFLIMALVVSSLLKQVIFKDFYFYPSILIALLFTILQFVRLFTSMGISTPSYYENVRNISTKRALTECVEWRKEAIETYKHMREHGNSGTIFLLEIILGLLCYFVLKAPSLSNTGHDQLSRIAILFFIWSMPAIGVYYLGHYTENQFSEDGTKFPSISND